MTVIPTPGEPLHTALRAHAAGSYCARAGAELLIGQRSWLRREDFTRQFTPGDQSMARVDWQGAIGALDAGALPCSGGEGRMLRIAASIAGGVPVDLGEALTGLDTANTTLVATAVLQATGHGHGRICLDPHQQTGVGS